MAYQSESGFRTATARMMRLTTMTMEAATTATMGIRSLSMDSPDLKSNKGLHGGQCWDDWKKMIYLNETANTSAQVRLTLPISELADPETHCSCEKSATVSGLDSVTMFCNFWTKSHWQDHGLPERVTSFKLGSERNIFQTVVKDVNSNDFKFWVFYFNFDLPGNLINLLFASFRILRFVNCAKVSSAIQVKRLSFWKRKLT